MDGCTISELNLITSLLREEAKRLRKFVDQTNPSDATPDDLERFEDLISEISKLAERIDPHSKGALSDLDDVGQSDGRSDKIT